MEASLPSYGFQNQRRPTWKVRRWACTTRCNRSDCSLNGAAGGLLFQKTAFPACFAFCNILMLLWLIITVLSPAPKAIKTSDYPVDGVWQRQSGRDYTAPCRSLRCGRHRFQFRQAEPSVSQRGVAEGFRSGCRWKKSSTGVLKCQWTKVIIMRPPRTRSRSALYDQQRGGL